MLLEDLWNIFHSPSVLCTHKIPTRHFLPHQLHRLHSACKPSNLIHFRKFVLNFLIDCYWFYWILDFPSLRDIREWVQRHRGWICCKPSIFLQILLHLLDDESDKFPNLKNISLRIIFKRNRETYISQGGRVLHSLLDHQIVLLKPQCSFSLNLFSKVISIDKCFSFQMRGKLWGERKTEKKNSKFQISLFYLKAIQ